MLIKSVKYTQQNTNTKQRLQKFTMLIANLGSTRVILQQEVGFRAEGNRIKLCGAYDENFRLLMPRVRNLTKSGLLCNKSGRR